MKTTKGPSPYPIERSFEEYMEIYLPKVEEKTELHKQLKEAYFAGTVALRMIARRKHKAAELERALANEEMDKYEKKRFRDSIVMMEKRMLELRACNFDEKVIRDVIEKFGFNPDLFIDVFHKACELIKSKDEAFVKSLAAIRIMEGR